MNWKVFGLNTLQSIVVNMALGSLGSFARQYPRHRLDEWLVRLGKAFGPKGLTHFSELPGPEQQLLLNRVPILNQPHTDWIKPFQWVPRTVTVWVGPPPSISQVLEGNVTPPLKPIPRAGEWYVLPGYMASTTIEGIHDRLGWRYDDIADYYELSVSLKFKTV